MPNPSASKKTKLDFGGATSDEFAKWLTKRFGGDPTANGYAAHDIFKHKSSESLQDEFGGEAMDDLMDFLQERQGFSDNPQPRQKGSNGFYGEPGWVKRKPAAPTGLITPFAKSPNAQPIH